MSEPERLCPRCGSVVLPPTATVCPQCGADVPPALPDPAKPPDIESWFEDPKPPPEPPAEELVILDEPAEAAPEEVPVVHPARPEALPEARPLPLSRPSEFPWPTRQPTRDDEPPIEKPKQQIGLAMVVVLLLTLATCGGVFVITYAIWAGFKRFAPKRTEVPPALVVACTAGPGRVA